MLEKRKKMGRIYILLGVKYVFNFRYFVIFVFDGIYIWVYCRLVELLEVVCISIFRILVILWWSIMIEGGWMRGVRGWKKEKENKKWLVLGN